MYVVPKSYPWDAPEDNVTCWETDPSIILCQYLCFRNATNVENLTSDSPQDGPCAPVSARQVSNRLFIIAIRGYRVVGNQLYPPSPDSPFFGSSDTSSPAPFLVPYSIDPASTSSSTSDSFPIPSLTASSGSASSSDSSSGSPASTAYPTPPTIPFVSLLPTVSHENGWKYRMIVSFERYCYQAIVDSGGRPWYHIDLLEEISQNPGRYSNLLEFWQGELAHFNQEWWPVFGAQLERWRDFLKHQVVMRETHKKTFLQYHRRVNSRLARHHINTDSAPINLVMDIEQQDKFTTWVEYLSFELSHHDRDAWYPDCEAEYHENWGLLLEAHVLEEGETREYIESTDYILVRDVETARARSAVEVLMAKILAGQRDILEVGQEDVLDPALKTACPFVELRDVEVELLEACDRLKLQKRRAKRIAEYLDATLAYRLARRRVHRSTLLLNWIREQVPLIRREMAVEEAYQADEDRENQDPAQVLATTEVPAAITGEDFGLIDLSTPASTPFVLTCDDFSTREGSLAPVIADSGVIDPTSGALLMPTFPDSASRESSESPESPPAEEASSSASLSGASKRSRSDDGTEDGEPKRLRGNTQSPPPPTEQADTVPSHRPPRDALTYANRLIGSGRLQHAQPWVEGHEDILEQYGNLRESYDWNGVREQGAGRSSIWDMWAGETNARRNDENDETRLEPDLDGGPPWGDCKQGLDARLGLGFG